MPSPHAIPQESACFHYDTKTIAFPFIFFAKQNEYEYELETGTHYNHRKKFHVYAVAWGEAG